MKSEELVSLGLTDEQARSVLALNGRDIEATKTKFGDYDTLKQQLSSANAAIEGFRGMDIDGIKRQSEDWKIKYEAAESKREKDLAALQFDHALSTALTGAKARNPKAVKALLDIEGLKLNGDDIIGLSDQLQKLKTDSGYLFEPDEATPRFAAPTPGATGQMNGNNQTARANNALREIFGRSTT